MNFTVKLAMASIARPSTNLVTTTLETPLEVVIDDWLTHAKLEESTKQAYRWAFNPVLRAGITHVKHLELPFMKAYLRARKGAGAQIETNNRALAAVGSLVRWLYGEGRFPLERILELRTLYEDDPTSEAPYHLRPPEYLELRAAALDTHETLDRAVFLSVALGTRPAETRGLHFDELHVRDLPPGECWAWVRPGKTKKGRSVPIDEAHAEEIRSWGIKAGPIFPARERAGEALRSPYIHPSTLRAWMVESRRHLSFPWDWLTLRHTFASWHVQEGTSIALVASWCGHSVVVCWKNYVSLMPGGNKKIADGFAVLNKLKTERYAGRQTP